MKILLLTAIFIINLNHTLINASSSSEIPLERSLCLIKNLKYTNEYLYSSSVFDDGFKKKIFTNQLDPIYMRNPLQSVWILEPSIYNNMTYFYVSNFYYIGEYLCGSNDHVDRLRYRRKVYLERNEKRENCLWRFSRAKNTNKPTFNIWNLKYNQSLYAASFFFKTSTSNRRNIFLWAKKPDSNQFNWDINCNTEIFLKNLYI